MNNKEKRKIADKKYQRDYHQAHKEERRLNALNWYKNNREYSLKKRRLYYKNNEEKLKAYAKQYYIKKRKERQEYSKIYYQANKNKAMEASRKQGWENHGINCTALLYNDILKFQGGKCAICKKTSKLKRLGVDHNHETGKIRGLLCARCNSALGLLGDNIAMIETALEYLRQ